ncbi:lipolysis-stimulated lipoprotein receptor isoform X4 [Rhincodon typus]|uniref:lipolysis-stimulated lipoprotein receptor isoform X4 n=1 Tax=Rhincodon typus TaxID=259920 RepID=UPI00202DDFBC|nr:lipolysis-stimulated lipoprotein receptor isoform X4 [Rhincodon typus]
MIAQWLWDFEQKLMFHRRRYDQEHFKAGFSAAIQVTIPDPFRTAILFQPVILKCRYDTTSLQPPIVLWKYKSFCRDRILDAFNPSSSENQVNDQLQQVDPNYNPYVNCPDSSRTVRTVASKHGKAVTLDSYYQGRKITIVNEADLSIEQTAWGDSGVYYCTVTASDDLSGNNEGYVELLVLVYHAGKAATAGIPSLYAPSTYAPSVYSHHSQGKIQPPLPVMVPMTQFNGGYGSDFDGASSVGNQSRVPLLHDQDTASSVRSGYRIQANQHNDDMRVLYYVEKELAHFDPKSPGDPSSKYENTSAMSEVSSLHEDYDTRNNLHSNISRVRMQAMPPIRDMDEQSVVSSVSRQTPRRSYGWHGADRLYQRARSMESLDDIGRRNREYPRDRQEFDRGQGRRESDSEASSRGYAQDRRRRDYSPESRHGEYRKRSHSRDDLMELERSRDCARRGYDESFLDEVLRKKRGAGRDADSSSGSTARSRARRDEDVPQPPPYTETESMSSRGRNEKKLRKNDAVSRESLVV